MGYGRDNLLGRSRAERREGGWDRPSPSLRRDRLHGTQETNALPLRVSELGGGTLIILLAPRF
jgi:hypothetical protein